LRNKLLATRRFFEERATMSRIKIITSIPTFQYLLYYVYYFEGGLLEMAICNEFHNDPTDYNYEYIVHVYS